MSRASARLEVVAIDGPAGAGKSSVAHGVAARLGWVHLDTGALYRAAAWLFLESQVDPTDSDAVGALCATLDLGPADSGRVRVAGRLLGAELREARVEALVSVVSALPALRAALVPVQRRQAERASIVAEGRDMGSVVFPDARYKFFLDASPEERARRRVADFEAAGRAVDLGEVLTEMRERDRIDRTREHSPLVRVADAFVVETGELSLDEVVRTIVERVDALGGGAR